jgi:hypothetical protein
MNSKLSKMLSTIGQGNIIVDKLLWEANSIVISARKQNTPKDFVLKFYGVVSAEIRTGQYDNFSLVGLQVEDISSYQMEGKKFRVASEDDQGYLFFYCNSLEVTNDE